MVSFPHCEHTVRVSTLLMPWADGGAAPNTATLLVLQVLQRLGSFLNCLSWKNNCSPAVKTKLVPQSMHFNILSWNSIAKTPFDSIPDHTFIATGLAKYSRWRGMCAPVVNTPPQFCLLDFTTLGSARHARRNMDTAQIKLPTNCSLTTKLFCLEQAATGEERPEPFN